MTFITPRIVIDTNTFVSAVLSTSSVPAQAVEKAFRFGFVLRSLETSAELENVLLRETFNRYKPIEIRLKYLEHLLKAVHEISVITKTSVCRDPKDDKFLELAIDGRADLIITGDNDLRVLHPFRGVAIMTAAEYLQR